LGKAWMVHPDGFCSLVQDNWQHADLHPGNIIVVEKPLDASFAAATWSRLADFFSPILPPHLQGDTPREVKLGIVDAGMTVSLSPEHFQALVQLYGGIAMLDGSAIGASMVKLRYQGSTAEAVDYDAFQRDVERVFREVDRRKFREHTQAVVAEVLEVMRRHRITMDGAASTVLLTVLALEGWATKLDPDIRILDTICELIPRPWKHRILAVVDRLMLSDVVHTP
jgi:aarF domain-containing kinase